MTEPTPLRPNISKPIPQAMPVTASRLLAQAKELADAAAKDALSTLNEGALRASDVSGDDTGQLLKPSVRDALKRLGEHVREQAEKIGRML